MRSIVIGTKEVGPGRPTYIIAEMSANHGQDLGHAIKIVEAAARAGADAVKLQTYTPDTLTIRADTEHFRIQGTLWEGRTLYDLYEEAYTPWDWHPKLKAVANGLGMDLFSTPFDATAVDFLENMGVPVHKIASFENIDLPLLRKVAATGKPVIMSTGMATLRELDESVATLRAAGNRDLVLLKCTSAYPAAPEEMNLRTIAHLAQTFDVPAGLSDHTMGSSVAVGAVALGACVIEKHFTLSRADGGPDSAFSMEPDEFAGMVKDVRAIEKGLGHVSYAPSPSEAKSRVFRRSLFIVEDVRAGDLLTPLNVRVIRPGFGLHPRHLDDVLGRRATRDAPRGTPVSWDLVGGTATTDPGAK